MWDNIERKACASPHHSVNDLKAAVDQEWQDNVIAVCGQVLPGLPASPESYFGCPS